MNFFFKGTKGKTTVVPGLISLAIPLIQLTATLSVEVSSVLSVKDFLFYPSLLNLVNFLVLLVTVGLTGTYWYWKEHEFQLRKDEETFLSRGEKITFNLLNKVAVLGVAALIVFVASVIANLQGLYAVDSRMLYVAGLVQYIAYATLLTSVGMLIYVSSLSYIEKKQTEEAEEDSDFRKNLMGALDASGHLPAPKVWSKKSAPQKSRAYWLVEVEIGKEKFLVETSNDGSETFEITKVESTT